MGVHPACFFINRTRKSATPERDLAQRITYPNLRILPFIAHQLASARKPLYSSAQRLCRALAACDPAVALYDEVALLLDWLGHDILSVVGPSYAKRCILYDFVTDELLARVPLSTDRLRCHSLMRERSILALHVEGTIIQSCPVPGLSALGAVFGASLRIPRSPSRRLRRCPRSLSPRLSAPSPRPSPWLAVPQRSGSAAACPASPRGAAP